MKKIKAIIQPFMLSKVAEALRDIEGFSGLTVTKVQGFGRDRAKGVPNRIVEDLIDYVPKVKIETVVNDTMVDEVVAIILDTAHTGNRGDGKVFVLEVSGRSGYGPERAVKQPYKGRVSNDSSGGL